MSASSASAADFIGRAVGWILAVTGVAGLAAAFALGIEKVRLLEDPTYTPVCSFDEVLSCTSVMTSEQSAAFGFPNPLLGIAGFAAVAALGAAIAGGASLSRWLWLTIQAGLTFAIGFVHWLFFQSVYRIEALCPFCMVVWLATLVAFVYVTLHNLAARRLPAPPVARRLIDGAVQYHSAVVIAWSAVLALLIAIAFWEHWGTLL